MLRISVFGILTGGSHVVALGCAILFKCVRTIQVVTHPTFKNTFGYSFLALRDHRIVFYSFSECAILCIGINEDFVSYMRMKCMTLSSNYSTNTELCTPTLKSA